MEASSSFPFLKSRSFERRSNVVREDEPTWRRRTITVASGADHQALGPRRDELRASCRSRVTRSAAGAGIRPAVVGFCSGYWGQTPHGSLTFHTVWPREKT